jgi:hypothetical protein
MNDITIVKDLPPYCFQLDYTIDHEQLMNSLSVLMDRIGQNMEIIHSKLLTDMRGYCLNLTHLPGMTGDDRFLKHTGKHGVVKSEGVDEKDFAEHLSESQDLYIGQVIHDLYKQHPGKFQGRANLLWLGPNRRYDFHNDPHTPHRYHVPMITNEECYFLFRNSSLASNTDYRIHMPTGTAWYLDPVNMYHTFVNNSNTPRLHLLLTSGF